MHTFSYLTLVTILIEFMQHKKTNEYFRKPNKTSYLIELLGSEKHTYNVVSDKMQTK